MIYGEIKELEFYKGISKDLDTAIDFILAGKYKEGKFGKNIVDGENVFFNLPEKPMTKNIEDAFYEGHKKYIDIHIAFEGKEKIGYIPNSKVRVSKEYDAKDDYELYEGDVETFFTLDPDRFIILFPGEPHMALVTAGEKPEEIKKVIFKILAK